MAYTTNVPLANQRISATQQPIQDNFIAIKTLIDVNHGTFGSATEGKHEKVTFPVQSPEPSFTGGDIGIYSFLDPATTVNELYVRKTGGAGVPFTAASKASAGYTYLPSGILMQWRFLPVLTQTTALTTLPLNPPIAFPNGILFLMITTLYNSYSSSESVVQLFDYTSTNVRFFSNNNKITGFNYVAIGY